MAGLLANYAVLPIKKYLLPICLILVIVLTAVSCSPEKKSPDISLNQLKKLCRLSTIEMKFHMCASAKGEETLWLNKIFNPDAKTYYFIEFDSSVSIGVDFKDLEINDTVGLIEVYISKPYLIRHKVDPESISKYPVIAYDENGIFTAKKILNIKDGEEAVSTAESALKKRIEDEKLNYDKAEENAKKLIENYIRQVCEAGGFDYKIKFEYID